MGASDASLSGRGVTDGDHDAAAAGENVLVLADPAAGPTDVRCTGRLSSPSGTGSPNTILVSVDEVPGSRLEAVVCRADGRSANEGTVRSVGPWGAPADRSAHGPGFDSGPWTTTVSSPGDLTGLGVRIGRALSSRAADGAPVELRFRSLTTLRQHVGERAVFRFCHAVTRHLAAVGASSRFHLDPGAVDGRTVATLSALFDRVEDRT